MSMSFPGGSNGKESVCNLHPCWISPVHLRLISPYHQTTIGMSKRHLKFYISKNNISIFLPNPFFSHFLCFSKRQF